MTELSLRQGTAFGVVLLAFLAYWPAVDNPFIADDYALLLGAERAAEHCTALFEMPLGWRRLVSNFFFTVWFAVFGAQAELFYWANLWLHVVNSLLVVRLVRGVAGDWRAAGAAGLFFVAYERHQEPVFWIGTSHELLLALGVLGTMFAFVRFRQTGRRLWYGLALALFIASIFTKESFVVLPPLLVLADLCGLAPRARPEGAEKRPERWWLPHAPFWLGMAGYAALMYAGPWPYPFGQTQSGLTLHFFSVYLRSLHRLLFFVYLYVGLVWLTKRLTKKENLAAPPLRSLPPRGAEGRAALFFAGWLLVTLVPYSFILYQRQLPSRHTYIPSVAAAALVGLLFAFVWERLGVRGWRVAWAGALGVCLVVNVVHLWRKDVEYLDRAAPTEQLIAVFDANMTGAPRPQVVVVYDFPYAPVIGRGAVRFRVAMEPDRLLFRRSGRGKPAPPGSLRIRWNPQDRAYDVLPNHP